MPAQSMTQGSMMAAHAMNQGSMMAGHSMMAAHPMMAMTHPGQMQRALSQTQMQQVPPNFHQRMNEMEMELMKLKVSGMHPMQATADKGLVASQVATLASHSDLTKAYNDLAKAHAELLQKYGDSMSQKLAQGSPSKAATKLRSSDVENGPSVVSNDAVGKPPLEQSLMDNTLLFLPERAVAELGIEPNMDDKGDSKKELWFGRLWELRALMKAKYQSQHRVSSAAEQQLTTEQKRDLALKLQDPQMKARLIRLQARWKGTVYRLRVSFAVLNRLHFCQLRGVLVYAHGSGGCSWDNMRICRMISRMGFLVIAPDGFAYPKDSAMGKIRHKDVLPLHKAKDDIDYWTGDLIYSSAGSGTATYSTKAEKVLENPDDFRTLYEKCYQLRRSELHFTIKNLPRFIKTKGFFLGGTSEGAMTIARFDDQRYGEMVIGRFINSFGIEYCYFTPTPEAGELGGQLDVPTLNIIGTKDQYFGGLDSVAKIVASDPKSGYGDKDLTGNGYKTLLRQGLHVGLVCVQENGVHSPCNTHDNFLRELFDVFFARPGSIWELDAIWNEDPTMKDRVQVQQSSGKLTQVFVPLPKYPNKWSLRRVEAVRWLPSTSATKEMEKELQEDARKQAADQKSAQNLLDQVRQSTSQGGGTGFAGKTGPEKSYYSGDKMKKTALPKR